MHSLKSLKKTMKDRSTIDRKDPKHYTVMKCSDNYSNMTGIIIRQNKMQRQPKYYIIESVIHLSGNAICKSFQIQEITIFAAQAWNHGEKAIIETSLRLAGLLKGINFSAKVRFISILLYFYLSWTNWCTFNLSISTNNLRLMKSKETTTSLCGFK